MARKKKPVFIEATPAEEEPLVLVVPNAPEDTVYVVDADTAARIAPIAVIPAIKRTPLAYARWAAQASESRTWSALTDSERAGFIHAARTLTEGRTPVTLFDHLFLEEI